MRSLFLVCVEGLSRIMGKINPQTPFYSMVPEVMMYATSVTPHLETIRSEYDLMIRTLQGCKSSQSLVAETQMGEIISSMTVKIAEIA